MNTANQCCCNTESQFSMRTVSNYCFLLFLALAIGSWCVQSASAATPSGTLVLVAPSPDAAPDEEFVVSVEILNPQNVYVFQIAIEYPDVVELSMPNAIRPGEGQFHINNLSVGTETSSSVSGRVQRQLSLGNNTDFISEGTLFTIKFETSELGNHWIEITSGDGYTRLQNSGAEGDPIPGNELPRLKVPVRGPIQGTVSLTPLDTPRVGEISFVDIELTDRSRTHRYEITVDPSTNLGPLTVSYNADDTNSTTITNHTAGDPITLGAECAKPNDPMDDSDLDMTYNDPIVATLFFTPATAGEGSLEITAAKIFDADDTELTLSNPEPVTFTIAAGSNQVTARDTGIGPTPIITVKGRTEANPFTGPFQVQIHFESDNVVEHVVNADASILAQRGVYGFARDEVMVDGTANASVVTRLWEADGGHIYSARINPIQTGTVGIWVPANVTQEVGTNLWNVLSEKVIVNVTLTNPPWDVDNNGKIQPNDLDLVEAALGQGWGPLVQCEFDPDAVADDDTKTGFECGDQVDENGNVIEEVVISVNENIYANTIEDPRTDVNGDQYVDQLDIDLVRTHLPDDGGAEGSGQSDETLQARSIEAPPDASVWMPDANLRRVVRKALGIGADENFTQEQLATLTKLTATKAKINDLTGLEYATSLTKLDLRTNRISDIRSLGGLIELTELKIGENNISDITALAGLTQLTHIGLAENKINDITALENLTNLTQLWLRANNVNDITALENLTKLKELSLEDNKISNVTALENLTNLKELWLQTNNINDITGLEHATHLRKLDLRTNRINDIRSLEGLTALTELKMGTNNITNITALAGLTQLTHIGLAHNKISNITALENLTNLKELWLRANNINDITALENLTKLKELNLQDNEISDITALENLTQLTYLNLSGNEIRDITALENLTNLTELWMADNDISDISPLSNMVKLKVLRIGGNQILDLSPLYPLIQGKLKWYGGLDIPQYPPWDVNEDGSVDATDSALVTAALGQSGNAIVDDRTDVNGDGTVNQDDLTLVTDNLDTDGGAPSISDLLTSLDQETLETLDRETLKTYLNTLRAESDGSPKYLRAIAMLENLLATTRPKQTQLLANYPNPFNPETWIPYQLANASGVQIIIYNTHGTVVRQLDLGHQPEGYYTTRSRAAYWDGRNTYGERVASSIYFYQLQADNISSLRKLLILK